MNKPKHGLSVKETAAVVFATSLMTPEQRKWTYRLAEVHRWSRPAISLWGDTVQDEEGNRTYLNQAAVVIHDNQNKIVCTMPCDWFGVRRFLCERITAHLSGEKESEALDAIDVKIDVYGYPSRHTDVRQQNTGVRMTHTPTGVSVTSEKERSACQNRAKAAVMLRAAVQRHKTDTV